MDTQFGREIAVAVDLARAAGAAIMTRYREEVRVDYKDRGQSDPVTVADRDANALIVRGLREAFPTDGILAEESPDTAERLSKQRVWCIDPLDGTREFIDHNGQFVVMIGLAIEGASTVGVVYQPTEDRMFVGAEGIAYVESGSERSELRPTPNPDPRQAVMMVSRSHRSKTVTRVAEALGVVREEPLGSVGLKTTRVAQGMADMYISVSNRTQEWDACAPEAIVRAAGGTMTDILGKPLQYNKPTTETPHGMLATNGPLHQACVDALRPIAEERGWR